MKYLKNYEYILNEAKFNIADDDLGIDVDAEFDEMSKYPGYFNDLLEAVKENNYTDFVGVILEQMVNNETFDKPKLDSLKGYINSALSDDMESKTNYSAFINQLRDSIEDWREIYKGKNFAEIHETDVTETIPELFKFIKAVAKDGIISFKEYKKMAAIIHAEDMCIDNLILSEYAQENNMQQYLDIFIKGMKSYINNLSQESAKGKLLIKKLNLMINVPNTKVNKEVSVKKSGGKRSGGSKLLDKFGIPTKEHTGYLVFTFEGQEHEIHVTNLTAPEVAKEVANIIGFEVFAEHANPKVFKIDPADQSIKNAGRNGAVMYSNIIVVLSEAGIPDADISWRSEE